MYSIPYSVYEQYKIRRYGFHGTSHKFVSEETIKLLAAQAPWCKVVVGGAVLNEDYANRIGADKYAKDAMDTVRYAAEIF